MFDVIYCIFIQILRYKNFKSTTMYQNDIISNIFTTKVSCYCLRVVPTAYISNLIQIDCSGNKFVLSLTCLHVSESRYSIFIQVRMQVSNMLLVYQTWTIICNICTYQLSGYCLTVVAIYLSKFANIARISNLLWSHYLQVNIGTKY